MNHLIKRLLNMFMMAACLSYGQNSLPDLSVTSIYQVSPPKPHRKGNTVEVYVSIINLGQVFASGTKVDFYYVPYSFSVNPGLTNYKVSSYNLYLGPNQSDWRKITFTIPQDLQTGIDYYYEVVVGPFENDANKANNQLRSNWGNKLFANVDFKLEQLNLDSTYASVGGYINTTTIVAELGNDDIYSNKINYYLTKDTTSDPTSWQLISTAGFLYTVNQKTVVIHSANIPYHVPVGAYYLVAEVRSSDYGYLDTTKNNVAYKPLSIVPSQIDLVVTGFSSQNTTASPASSIMVSYTEQNIGFGKIGQHLVGFYLSMDTIYDSKDKYLDFGSMHSVETLVYIPKSVISGEYYLIARADYKEEVPESNENNNTKAIPISIQTVTNIDEKKQEAALLTYPNPSNGILCIQNLPITANLQLDIYNLRDQMVFSTKAVQQCNDVSTLPKGMYIIRLTKEDQQLLIQKVIINN